MATLIGTVLSILAIGGMFGIFLNGWGQVASVSYHTALAEMDYECKRMQAPPQTPKTDAGEPEAPGTDDCPEMPISDCIGMIYPSLCPKPDECPDTGPMEDELSKLQALNAEKDAIIVNLRNEVQTWKTNFDNKACDPPEERPVM